MYYGTDLTSIAVLRWAIGRVAWHYIQPGKPVQNAFIESANSGCVMNASRIQFQSPGVILVILDPSIPTPPISPF